MNREAPSQQLIILGFGGHARSVADVALVLGYKSLVFVDEQAREGEIFLNFPVFKSFTPDEPKDWCAFPASGNSSVRQAQTELIEQQGWQLVSLIAPSATLGIGCKVGNGVFVGQQAHIGPMAKVGRGSIINTGAVVEHECNVGEWTHISVNATMAGRTSLGDFSMLGAGSTVIDGLDVASNVTIGAGAVVIKNIRFSGIYVGAPAHRLP
jgi:sugar O-acyltransferase (sialic acid O-acetyltransferase NeuD family)